MKTLKRLVSSNHFFYRIWFYGYLKRKNNKLRLPKANDLIYFDGYPRSGNTYTYGIIYRIFPALKIGVAHHLHSIAGLKMALNNRVKSLIIIRQPKDAIMSFLFAKKELYHKNPEVLEELIIRYIDYYKFVKKNSKTVKIINFDSFVENEESSIINIGKWICLDPEENIKEMIIDYKGRMINFQKVQNQEYSAMPNEARIKFKAAKIKLVLESKNYQIAERLYNDIIQLNSVI